MIYLKIICSMCGIEFPYDISVESEIITPKVRKLFKDTSWIIEKNGKYIDTYCSEKCAK